jgi:multidrug efflux pump
VIMTGLSIGTLFTLFVVPAMYMMLGEDHTQRREPEEPLANEPVQR